MDEKNKVESSKCCRTCKKDLPLSEFWKSPKHKDGLMSACRSCMSATKWGKTPETEESARNYHRQYRRDNKDSVATSTFKHGLRKFFQMTLEQYLKKLEAQDGVCAVCKEPPNGIRLAVDHDHTCCPGRITCGNCIRDLLCGDCNRAIGIMNDSPERLEAAAQYLRDHRNY